ncbi:hypothetical protein [Crocosphaera chwakensis]|nr:hypothetical protein [Crocosphaera chwakensis]
MILASNQEANQQNFQELVSYLPPSRSEVSQEMLGISAEPKQELKKAIFTQGISEHKLALEVIELITEDKESFFSQDFSDYSEIKLLASKHLISCEIEKIKRIIKTSNIVTLLLILLLVLLFVTYSYFKNKIEYSSLFFSINLWLMISSILFLLKITWLKSSSLLTYQKLMRIITLTLSLSNYKSSIIASSIAKFN